MIGDLCAAVVAQFTPKADTSCKMALRPAALLGTLLLCLYGAPSAWCECNNATQLSVQVDTMLAEYDRDTPPASKVSVLIGLDVRHATVDHQTSVMRMLADLKMSWQDPRIGWNETEWGCDSALTSSERLWLPDIVILNAAATNTGEGGLRARLGATGSISWINRLDVTVPVALALQDWPHDKQLCTFKFGSRAYNDDELELIISEFKHAVVFESGSWEIQTVSRESSTWQRGEEVVSIATWTVKVLRRAPAHALAVAAVLVAGALLLATAAALPPQQRPMLAACASFIAALWLTTALVRLPGASTTPRAMSVMCVLCVCGALTGACAALVVRIARLSVTPPGALRTLLSSLSTICRLTPSADSSISSESGAWTAAAVLADRVLSFTILLTLLVLLIVQIC